MKSRIAAFLVPLASLALCSCLGNSGNPASPPSGVQTFAGDGAVSVTWNVDPTVIYWVFHAQDPTITTGNDGWDSLLFAGVIVNAFSPSILCNQINNSTPSQLFPEIYFTVNGRTGTAPGGPGSTVVNAAPRLSGGPAAPWIPGNTIPSAMTGLGYAAITPCGYAGRPASGMFIAVGPNGTIYSSSIAPIVAGPLSPSQGNSTMIWVRGAVPSGFNTDLVSVASYTGTLVNPTAPGLVMVAVGKNGAVLRSVDGQNWQLVTNVPTTNNLNAVASTGSGFIAVGDSGVVLTSSDGINWLLSATAAQASSNTLNAIRCIGPNCVAVGTSGATLWTLNGGGNWGLYTIGNNSWTTIAYGNNNANADSIVSTTNNTLSIASAAINTWVVADALGNFAWTNTSGGGGWSLGNTVIASSIVAMDYATRFLALDGAGNVYASETGSYNWQLVSSSKVPSATALSSNRMGFVALGSNGTNSSSF